MTVQELQARLFELDIPHYYYNICGTGDDDEQRICLVHENGKWIVFYSENGDRTDVSEYLEEADACADCLSRLTE